MTASSDRGIKAAIEKVGYSKPGINRTYPLGRTQLFGVHCSSFRLLQLLAEYALACAVVLTVLVFTVYDQNAIQMGLLKLSLTLAAILVICNCGMGLYSSKQAAEKQELLLRLGLSFIFSFLSIAFLSWVMGWNLAFIETIAAPTVLAIIFIYGGRVLTQRLFLSSDALTKRVLILGEGHRADQVFDILYSYSEGAYCLHRLNKYEGDTPEEFSERISHFVATHNISEIVLAFTEKRQKLPISVLIECRLSGISVRNPIEFLERESGLIHFDFLDLGWIVFAEGFVSDRLGRFAKRIIDLLGSSALLLLASPIFLIAATAIKLDKTGTGPVFYRQTRVGLGGRLFSVWKFRSMFTDAEADGKAIWAKENDCRVTPVGAVLRKYRVDELPQLFNVLKGEMSLVGPRPERPEFVSELSDLHVLYSERHRVKPGLTGWAQMRFPYTASANDSIKKLQYDMYYVKNRSLLLDILILLQTVEVVLCGKGAR